jgi:uncharacterized surface protein with fasciclin (FAS1) repeats
MFNLSYRTKLSLSVFTVTTAIAGTTMVSAMPPSTHGQAVQGSQAIATDNKQTIVDIAASAGSFKTLTAALKAADLVEVLEGKGPFTVFAPTDEAFAALPPGTLDALLKPENKDDLVKILTYHVVPGAVMSSDLKAGKVATVEGSKVTIQLGDSVKVDGAQVVKADIEASNGVIHVIDKVILPSN